MAHIDMILETAIVLFGLLAAAAVFEQADIEGAAHLARQQVFDPHENMANTLLE